MNRSLAIIGGRVAFNGSQAIANVSFGKVVEAFALEYDNIFLSCPVKQYATTEDDYFLPKNVIVMPQPDWTSTLDSLRHLRAIKKSYQKTITRADHVFIRGNPVAATSYLYRIIANHDKPVCHWLVGNPMVLMNSHNRYNKFKDFLSCIYIYMWEKSLVRGRERANGSFLCNGQELADRYPTPKTTAIVSTTLTQQDFFWREDTCKRGEIVLLCLCYIRPEKGIEYLIEAMIHLKLDRPVKLLLAGSRDRYPQYQSKLDAMISKLQLTEQIRWLGHVRHQNIHELMVSSDIFILPTLSEGTPRVLLEARAKGLPVVSTNVGGIPTSVTHGKDGLLVPPKSPVFLAKSIQNIIDNECIRRHLIKEGYASARNMTLDKFVSSVMKSFNS